MSTRFKLDIHRSSLLNEDIMKIVANHNGGLVNASLNTFKGLIEAYCCIYPHTFSSVNFEHGESYSITVTENGTPLITIQEFAYYELQELSEEHALQIYEGQEGEIINQ